MDDMLKFEPLKYYNEVAREKHRKNIIEHFESLVKASGVNREANRETVQKYRKELKAIQAFNKSLQKYRVIYFLLIVLSVIGFLSLPFGVYLLMSRETLWGIVTFIGGVIELVTGILVNIKVISPKIDHMQDFIDAHTLLANQLLTEAEAQMAPLNALFDDEDTLRLIEKTMPDFSFDRRYSPERMNSLNSDFDYLDLEDETTSVIDTLSGSLYKNPFVFERHYRMFMGEETYTGTKTIHWTERVRSSNGKYVTRTRTQVLTATLVKPRPYYKLETQLGYGSLAAPDLSFSRSGTHVEDLSERARDKKVLRGERKLKKKTQKAIAKGKSFQDMVNSEFDVLFGAIDRDHEIQFRVMYTPLAQQNTVDLITSEIGYGDDFKFMKRKKYNIIKSEHAQSWQMHVTAATYRSFDIDEALRKFLDFNETYFKSVFFDFAPLMAVPVYHDEPDVAMKTPEAFKMNYTPSEHEVLANAIGADVFKHPDTRTNVILKTVGLDAVGNIDRVRVTANSFTTADRLDFVPVFGGDGRTHSVPVHWLEYIPLKNITDIAVCALDHSERMINIKIQGAELPPNCAYNHGLMAFPIAYDSNVSATSSIFNRFK